MKTGMRHEATGNSKNAKLFGVALCALLFALSVPAQAQQPTKIPRIGIFRTPMQLLTPRAPREFG